MINKGRRLNAMDYEPDTGVLYASVNAGFRGSGPNFLATVDPNTGVVTNVGQSVNGLDAIAWRPIDPKTKDDCKNGAWETFGFRNQGQCIRFVNTGKDSR